MSVQWKRDLLDNSSWILFRHIFGLILTMVVILFLVDQSRFICPHPDPATHNSQSSSLRSTPCYGNYILCCQIGLPGLSAPPPPLQTKT